MITTPTPYITVIMKTTKRAINLCVEFDISETTPPIATKFYSIKIGIRQIVPLRYASKHPKIVETGPLIFKYRICGHQSLYLLLKIYVNT